MNSYIVHFKNQNLNVYLRESHMTCTHRAPWQIFFTGEVTPRSPGGTADVEDTGIFL